MSYNGSGTFLINSAGQPVVANTVISATVFNALTSDLATGLSTAITKDGQTTITANIPFGSNKITGLGSGTAATDAANLGQVQSTAAKLITVTGTDTITGSMSPALTAYAAGQLFYFVSAGANTGPVTINIDSLGAKAITRDGATALANGDINSGEVVVVIYDGTRFQMINAANSFGNTTINGTLTVTGNTGLQANVSITSTLSVHGTFGVTGAATLGSTLAVTGKSDLPTVSTASVNAAVAAITTATVTNLTATSASVASVNAGVALLTTATVTNLTATGASIASANIGNLQFTAASIASINAGVAVITNLTATGASIASANVGTAVITTGTVTNLTATSASIASANVGTAVITTGTVTNLTSTSASVASINAAVALITTGTVTALTATGASVASANVGTAVVTGLTVTGASIASVNVGAAVLSGNLTLSAGTANGVLYLNGSKVATSGSALTFDGSTLGTTGNIQLENNKYIAFKTNGGSVFYSYYTNTSNNLLINGYNETLFLLNNAEGMRLTSTGLGIGTTSPKEKLDSRGAAVFAGDNTTGTNAFGTASGLLLSTSSDNTKARITAVSNGANSISLVLRSLSSGSAVDAVTIDPSGNLGLGVTPSAWSSDAKALQFPGGSLSGYSTSQTNLTQNAFLNASSNFVYVTTAAASAYRQISGAHSWYTAASGTAGNAITFTQAMTLDASGNLALGRTSVSTIGSGYRTVDLDGENGSGVRFRSNGTSIGYIYSGGTSYLDLGTSGAYLLTFTTNTTERGRFTSGGFFKASNTGTYANSTDDRHELRSDKNDINVLVGTTSTGSSVVNVYSSFPASPNAGAYHFAAAISGSGYQFTVDADGDVKNTNNSYGSISDIKLKQDIVDASSQWNDIKNLRVRKYRFKDKPDEALQIGVIAQELEQISPGLVEESVDRDKDGNDLGTTTKSVKYSVLYMKSVKALQEAMARIEQLEAKVAALEA